MSGQKVLLPTPAVVRDSHRHDLSRTVEARPADAEGPIAGEQGGGKQRRHRHTAQEWEDLKECFEELYFQEDSSLEDVRQEMKRDYGFEASIRQYKIKIKEWGLEKNFKASDMQILHAKQDKRTRDRGVGTVFVVKGVKFEEDRLNRFGKRELTKSGDYVSPSAGMSTSEINATPSGVCYYTPQSIIDAESPHVDTDDVFILQSAHHYRKVGPITTVQATFESVQTPTREGLASLAHPHQAAGQYIACRGRFSDGDKATKLLWQARNFATGLAKIMLEPGAAGELAKTQ